MISIATLVVSFAALISISINLASNSLLFEENLSGPTSIYIASSDYIFYAILAVLSNVVSIMYIIKKDHPCLKSKASFAVTLGTAIAWLVIACVLIPTVVQFDEIVDLLDGNESSRNRMLVDLVHGSAIAADVAAWILTLLFAMNSILLSRGMKAKAEDAENEVAKETFQVAEVTEVAVQAN
jgi:hypothetical protein